MNIAIFSQHFWPENFRINEVAYELNSKNNVSVVTGLPNYPSGKIFSNYRSNKPKVSYHNNIKIIRLPIFPRYKGTAFNLMINYLSFILSGIININYIKKNMNPDIIFVYGTSPILQAIPAIIFSKIKKIPLVLWVQDLWPESVKDTGFIKNKFLLSIINKLVTRIYKSSDKILLQSPEFSNHYNIKPFINKCSVHFNPSEFQIFEKKKDKVNKSKTFKMIYAGNLGKAQNLNFIFDLAAYSNSNNLKIKFILIGDGSEKNNIKKRIIRENLGNFIEIQKPKLKNELNKILNECDSLILALNDGIVLSKTIPAKFQTYLFFSKPIFSVSSGIVNNLINKYKLGLAANSNDKNIILKNFKKLYSYTAREKNIHGDNCYNFYLKYFEIKKSCENLDRIFKKVIN